MFSKKNTDEPTEGSKVTTGVAEEVTPEIQPEEVPEIEAAAEEIVEKIKEEKVEEAFNNPKCPPSPTGDHDVFHNEGTGEKYCRYCGKTK